MENKLVKFLGNEYTIPYQLKDFIKYLNYFEHMLDKDLMPLLLSEMKRKEWSDDGNSFSYYESPMKIAGEKVIKNLLEQNVYDITLQDLVYNNKGYLQLKQVCHETLEEMRNILIDSMNEWQAGYNSAYSSASSNITGMGFSVWTNSLSSALLYSAMEASTLKKQTNQANREFQSAMSALNKTTGDRQQQRENNVLVNKYYPRVAESLSLFVSQLTEMFLHKSADNGQFDSRILKEYDLARSSGILNNLKLVQNKKDILTQAFICCPYNPDIYQAIIKYDLIDFETFETAKFLLQDSVLCDEIKSYCIKHSADIAKISEATKVYSSYTGKSEIETLKSVYKDKVRIVNKHFSELRLALSSNRKLTDWICRNISRNAVDFSKMERSVLKKIIESKIKNIGVSSQIIAIFFDKKLITLSELTGSNVKADNLEQLYDYFISNMETAIFQYLDKLIEHINSCISMSNEKKEEFEAKQKAYLDRINEYKQDEKSLQQERDRLGIFAFSKKKDLDSKISACVSEREEFEKSNNPYRLKDEADRLMDKADEYI
ncbi:hypothetical protein [Lachnoclostridium sp. MSJ-17]|uniref:hypothetical protein n=1 Tax=Lachnoclostridium sp. MSJ-17 TaxID=2841516 RepID=UPI001C1277BD|nr:hypothetical protein [Lachnoclostridium sp. MSJ-17]MBU5462765.1 hypothetical protein [Lachnoclostridium sp. MSJ-17]